MNDTDRILKILESAKDKNGAVPMSIVRKAFDKLLSAAQPQWIPVSERLPEKGGLYLVTLKRFSEAEICTRYFNKGTDGDFWSGCWGNTRVLAWMPLPIPFGGET